MTSTDFKILQKQNYNNGKMQYVIQIVCGCVDFQILYHFKPIKEILKNLPYLFKNKNYY
jgi:hypothetical protein